eukprot:2349725-Amphidinium_carterae.2
MVSAAASSSTNYPGRKRGTNLRVMRRPSTRRVRKETKTWRQNLRMRLRGKTAYTPVEQKRGTTSGNKTWAQNTRLASTNFFQIQHSCTHCHKPLKSKVLLHAGSPVIRCGAKGCQKYSPAWQHHPLILSRVSLHSQVGVIWCLLQPVPRTYIPAVVGLGTTDNHVRRIALGLKRLVAEYVRHRQSLIMFTPVGAGRLEVEADESYFGLDEYAATVGEAGQMVSLITYIGMKAQGMNDNLVLHKRDKEASSTICKQNGRACPAPLSKAKWQEIGNCSASCA